MASKQAGLGLETRHVVGGPASAVDGRKSKVFKFGLPRAASCPSSALRYRDLVSPCDDAADKREGNDAGSVERGSSTETDTVIKRITEGSMKKTSSMPGLLRRLPATPSSVSSYRQPAAPPGDGTVGQHKDQVDGEERGRTAETDTVIGRITERRTKNTSLISGLSRRPPAIPPSSDLHYRELESPGEGTVDGNSNEAASLERGWAAETENAILRAAASRKRSNSFISGLSRRPASAPLSSLRCQQPASLRRDSGEAERKGGGVGSGEERGLATQTDSITSLPVSGRLRSKSSVSGVSSHCSASTASSGLSYEELPSPRDRVVDCKGYSTVGGGERHWTAQTGIGVGRTTAEWMSGDISRGRSGASRPRVVTPPGQEGGGEPERAGALSELVEAEEKEVGIWREEGR